MVTRMVHVTGARPNFPKAAPVIAALRRHGVAQTLVHTGQHYDDRLSEVFFRELDLPRPDVNLGVGSGSAAQQTAAIMVRLEELLLAEPPALVVVYGDVNSTVAAALVAAKIQVPVAHVEAGLRSFDMTMPEEVNRRLTDQLCDLLFATSADAVGHLTNEGVPVDRVHLVGNPMIDTLLSHLDRLRGDEVRKRLGLDGDLGVVTLHRPSNVDDPVTARRLVGALHTVAQDVPLVVPLHPRGRKVLESVGLSRSASVHVVDPLPYTEFMGLVSQARLVLTDSGGVQEETTVLGVPCLTMRPNTERPVTITHGTNRLVGPDDVVEAARAVVAGKDPVARIATVPPLWDGRAGERIAEIVTWWLDARPGGGLG